MERLTWNSDVGRGEAFLCHTGGYRMPFLTATHM